MNNIKMFFSPTLSLYHDNLETDASASASKEKQEEIMLMQSFPTDYH